MFPHLGPMELIIILVIALMIFGAGKLPEVGSALGRGIREFKKATQEEPPEITATTATPPASAPPPAAAPQPSSAGPFCPQCGTQAVAGSRFCAKCGASLPTAAA
ncbi:MAG TPA: twin-arginine translocase TatA/TatE family subunit [Chloroflexota bacterium]|nr:twin-arginine translocase TatA/TatE family subunit [Chloroflexota bacterium]